MPEENGMIRGLKEEIKYFKPTPFKRFSPVGDSIAAGELTGLELSFCFHSLSSVTDFVILWHKPS